jgi:plasmid stabilization system protein ParE
MTSARRDLADILDYLTRKSGSLAIGEGYIISLRQESRKLASFPGNLGRSRPELRPDIRSFAFRNCIVAFRYQDETVR